MVNTMDYMLREVVQRNGRREHDSNAVRLEALKMPEFHGKVGEDLYRFLDQISHFLGNYVRPAAWVARLKDAAEDGARAFHSVLETERSMAHLLVTRANPATGLAEPPTRQQWID